MAKVIFGMAMSLDSYIHDSDGNVGALYENLADMRYTEVMEEAIAKTGAVVMGRRTYDMAQGDYTGYEFQVPIFVVTHQAPEQSTRGQNENLKFNFVTDGVESAIQQAKAAAGDDKWVTIVGGVNIFQQALELGLIDQLDITIVPVLLGGGLRLFDKIQPDKLKLERIRQIESPDGRTDISYRVVK